MSAALMFDTLAFANKLKNAGVPANQAEAQSVALAEVLSAVDQELVTKSDLKGAVTLLRTEIKDLENRLLLKLGAALAVSVGIMSTLITIFH